MPSEHRLHPASILFNILKQLRAFAVPLVLLVVGLGTRDTPWQDWAPLVIVPYAGAAIARYMSFRYRYDDRELFIKWGIVFRNERHVPYERIQNIDAVQTVLHRMLGVVEVRLQTASGTDPEATLSVLTLTGLEEMRARVFAGRARPHPTETLVVPGSSEQGDPVAASARPCAAAPPRQLLRLTAADLARYGFIENRGLVVIAAALGLLSEFVQSSQVIERVLGEEQGSRLVRSIGRAVFADGLTFHAGLYLAAAVLLFLLVSRVFSIAWAMVRLHGFIVTESGADLRVEYGLLTRVTATIPRRRVQTVTVRETPLHRLLGYAAVRVATAGGASGHERAATQREWLAPIIRRDLVPSLLTAVLPGAEAAAIDWQPVHPRALRRVLRRNLSLSAILAAASAVYLGGSAVWPFAALALWAALTAVLYVRRLGWARTADLIALRTGTVAWVTTCAPLSKIQVVTRHESPFDRRHGMARVRVDTAGTTGGFPVDLPYLSAETADRLQTDLSGVAARTTFQW